MNPSTSPNWSLLNDLKQFQELIDKSKMAPILIMKFDSRSDDHLDAKSMLEKEWQLEQEVESFLLDVAVNPQLASTICEELEIVNHPLQVILLADEVAIYDEAGDMISVKKINLALRIVGRTFKWSALRSTKKASG